jgi:hypothetical protein
LERLANQRGKDLSEMIAHLVARGLDCEMYPEPTYQTRVIDSLVDQFDQLQAQIEALENREAERFLRQMGHLQNIQAQTTEVMCEQRVKMAEDRPRDYQRAIDQARNQVYEDAKLYRESVAVAGPSRRAQAGKGTGQTS